MFPQYFLDKIKEVTDLDELAEEYTTIQKAGPLMFKGHCPHPDHVDKDPSLRIWKKGYKSGGKVNKYDSWACMVCHNGKKSSDNLGSDCFAFVQWVENIPWKSAVIKLANRKQIPIPTDKNEKLYKQKKNLAYSFMDNLKGEALEYLQKRGLAKEDCFEWGVGFDGAKITFPLLDRYKNVLGFTRRWINPPVKCNDKYKNSTNSAIFNKSMYLYGIHTIDESFDEIRITEGAMDVILPHKYGAKNVFATLGTSFTEGHVDIIKHYGKIPVFCMDGDEAGLKAINKSIELLASHGIYSKVLILPPGKDLADMALELKENIEDYIQDNSITYGNYLIQKEINLYQAKLNELKLKYYPNLKKILAKVPTQEEAKILKTFVKNTIGIDM